MKDPIRVEVTPEHIKNGVPDSSESCALALAFKSAGFPKARVGITSVWLEGFEGNRFATLPRSAEKFAQRFDDGAPVAPFSFEIDDVREVVCGG